jgi:hypothetical protein
VACRDNEREAIYDPISFLTRCGLSPSHEGFMAVASKTEVVSAISSPRLKADTDASISRCAGRRSVRCFSGVQLFATGGHLFTICRSFCAVKRPTYDIQLTHSHALNVAPSRW